MSHPFWRNSKEICLSMVVILIDMMRSNFDQFVYDRKDTEVSTRK